MIKQLLEVDILAADALGGVKQTLLLGASIIRSNINVFNCFANSLPSSLKFAF